MMSRTEQALGGVEWELGKIGDFCIVGDGAHGSLKRVNSGIMYLSSKNFKDGRLNLSKVDYITNETYDKYFRKTSKALTKISSNDVLVSIIGTVGEAYLVQHGDYFGISSSVAILRTNSSKVYPKYLFYWVRGNIFQGALYGIKGGVAQSYISLEMIRSLPLYIPPIEIQHQIATALSTYDEMIDNNTRRIQALEQAAHDLYREWFVEFRFPNHENVPFVDSGTDYGMIPQGWEVVKLQEIADINALSINNGNIPVEIEYIDISSVSTDRVDSTQILPFKDAPGRARRIVRSGDTIWATVRPNRRSYALILRPAANLIVSTGFAVITPLKVPYSYLYKAITTEFFSDYLTNHATGSAYPAVNANDFKRADILVPKIDVAEKFHHIVADFYDQKALLEQRNNNLQKARDLLLPRLVSGQLDVNEIELEIGEAGDG